MQQGATTSGESLRTCCKCGKYCIASVEIKPKGRVCFTCQLKQRRLSDKRWRKAWSEETRAKHNSKNREWRRRNPDQSYAATKRWRYRNPEKARVISKEYRDRIIKDPIRHEISLENKRINEKLRLERNGGTPRVISLEKYREGRGRIKYSDNLPVAPLVEYIEWLQLTPAEVALMAGCDEALVRRIMLNRNSRKVITTIDQICTAIGVPMALLYDDIPLEAV